MKKTVLPVFAILLLCACSSSEKLEENFESWRTGLEKVSATAVVTISVGEQASEYELKCDYNPEKTVVEIISPENLKGVAATRGEKDTQLEFDGLILELGEINGISPVNTLPHLIDTLRKGYVSGCSTEKYGDDVLLSVEFSPQAGVGVRVWLNEDNIPVRADFVSDTYAGIKIEITDWNLE